VELRTGINHGLGGAGQACGCEVLQVLYSFATSATMAWVVQDKYAGVKFYKVLYSVVTTATMVWVVQDKYAGVKFYKFDTTEEALEQYAADLGVGLLPTFRFYKGGKQVQDPVTGYKKRPLEEAVEKLAKL
jgi:hypothetical protein